MKKISFFILNDEGEKIADLLEYNEGDTISISKIKADLKCKDIETKYYGNFIGAKITYNDKRFGKRMLIDNVYSNIPYEDRELKIFITAIYRTLLKVKGIDLDMEEVTL